VNFRIICPRGRLYDKHMSAPDLFTQASEAAAYIRTRTTLAPRIGIILGSGLGAFGAEVQSPTTIPYSTIPHFPQSTVEGHSGNLILGTIAGIPVAVMQGRVHAYEGYAMSQVTFPTRVLGLLGVTTLIVTNAAGGIDPAYAPGTLVAISDHINLTGTNAALGPNEPRFGMTNRSGLRFFDMTTAYSPALRTLAIETAAEQGFTLPEGVYIAVLGPSYETPAEIRAFRTLGASLVGMSTVHEVIVARHMGLEILGISLVTNPAAGVTSEVINHEEVMDIGRAAESRFTALLTALIPRL
jgi:purine-nucleoside phosphorylase